MNPEDVIKYLVAAFLEVLLAGNFVLLARSHRSEAETDNTDVDIDDDVDAGADD